MPEQQLDALYAIVRDLVGRGRGERVDWIKIKFNDDVEMLMKTSRCPCVTQLPDGRQESYAELIPGDGFRTLSHGGKLYAFTSMQAKALEVLYNAWHRGVPDVEDATLFRATGSVGDSLGEVFTKCEAWGTLIVQGARKGLHRLSPPCPPKTRGTPGGTPGDSPAPSGS